MCSLPHSYELMFIVPGAGSLIAFVRFGFLVRGRFKSVEDVCGTVTFEHKESWPSAILCLAMGVFLLVIWGDFTLTVLAKTT